MSKITNYEGEPSVTCGFYNSLNSDRKYDALQMSSLFDGFIKDGIFMTIGEKLIVTAGGNNAVIVGTGKCWFNHTWTENDAPLRIVCDAPETSLFRMDAIVIEVNSNDSIRDNFIKYIKGPTSTSEENASYPEMTQDESAGVYQYPLCYIKRPAGSAVIAQSDIVNKVGTDETPFISGLMETVSLNEMTRQWEAELDEFIIDQESDFSQWFSGMKTLAEDAMAEIDTWTDNQKTTILNWFDNLQTQLSGDVAVNLQLQITENEIKRMLTAGLVDGTKTYSEDARVITSVDSSGYTLVKTYNDDFSVCTIVLTDSNGGELGRLVKTFASDGSQVSIEAQTL